MEEKTTMTIDDLKSVIGDVMEKNNATILAHVDAKIGELAKPAENKLTGNHVTVGDDREAAKPFKSFGEQAQAIYAAANPGAVVDKRLLHINEKAPSGMGGSVGSAGGFLVQHEFIPTLVTKMHETGMLASRCDRIPVGAEFDGVKLPFVAESSRANGSRWGGIRAYWKDEGSQLTASQPAIGEMDIALKDLTGYVPVTNQLLRDATALGAWLSQGFGEEFGFKMDDAIIRGDGATKPLGLINAAAKIAVSAEIAQGSDTVIYKNILNMFSRMPGRNRANAVWLIESSVEPQLWTMTLEVGQGGAPVYLPPGGASASPYATLLGRPVLPMEQCYVLGVEGDIILADLSQYLLIDKDGIEAAESIHLRFDYNETVFRFIYRVNGQPKWSSALTPYSGGSTLSPYVTLATTDANGDTAR